MRKQEKKHRKILLAIKEHFKNNIKEYLIVSIVFLIGIVIGVTFINNLDMEQKNQVQEYISNFTKKLNSDYEIDNLALIKSSITSNLILAIALWFIGSTVIGIPIVYLIIGIRGFSLGYTISAIISTFPIMNGICFTVTALLLQNIIYIPCMLALGVSGIKLYKSIVKDKRKENIKLEIVRHTIFSGLMALLLVIASFVEVYGSANLLTLCIKIFA